MKIGTRISPDWLERPEDLRFLKQIGVDCVDITMPPVPSPSMTFCVGTRYESGEDVFEGILEGLAAGR